SIQMVRARKRCDPYIRALVDQLDDAYYGTPQPDNSRLPDGWKHGVLHPFFLWDVQSTPAQSKLAFDALSGVLHHLTFLLQHLFNQDHRGQNATDPEADYDKEPEGRYNAVRDDLGNVVETKVRRAKRWMREMATQWNAATLQPPMNRARFNQIVNFIRNRPKVAELLARRATLVSILDIDDEADVSE
ncbi:MAG TPA: hypothetical protein VII92_04725, partial [Anaerolineae bacterium]